MKVTALILASILLAGCATQEVADEESTQDRVQAIRDYIAVRGLEEVRRISASNTENSLPLTQYFVFYVGSLETHLIEFERRCWRNGPDDRRSARYIHADFDTVRGCRVVRIYKVTEEEIAELESIQAGVGSYN